MAGTTKGDARDTLAAVLRAMITDPTVLDEVTTAARTSPEIARLPRTENHRHIEVLLASGLAGFERPEADPPPDDPTATRLGADRAEQGIPLTALLRGVHAGRIRALQIGVERGRAAGVPDAVLLDALLLFDRHAGAMERHVIAGYHAAELERARTARDERTQVLRRLLHGGPGPAPGAEELRRAGLRLNTAYRCVLADVANPVDARALERRLTAPDALFGLVDGRFTGLLPESAETPRPPATAPAPTPAPANEGASSPAGEALVLIGPAVPLPALPDTHRLCADALEAARAAGTTGPHLLTDLAAQTALAARPDLAALLTAELLGRLDPADAFHRELARTALMFLDLGHRLDLTAAALHLHPNTVRYRLAKLSRLASPGAGAPASAPRESAQQELDDPRLLPTLRWWWALRTWLAAAAAPAPPTARTPSLSSNSPPRPDSPAPGQG